MASYALREVHYSSESTFGDSTTTTYATRIPVLEANLTISQSRSSDGSLQNRQNDSRPGYLGVRSATLEIKCYVCGHNTSPTGALTETWLADLLSDALGGIDTTQVGAVLNGSPSTTSFPTAAGTFTAGAMGRIGVKGDTRGDGQAFVVGTGGTTCTPILNGPAAPNAGDQFYPMLTVYPTESPTTTKRFQVMHATTGAQFHLYGCQAESIMFDLPMGGLPTVTIRYQAAYWKRSAITFPGSTTLENCNVKPITGGSFVWVSTGTGVRTTISPASYKLTLDIGLSPTVGPSSNQQSYQIINGWERTKCIPTLEFQLPWETSLETLFDTDGSSTTLKQVQVTCSAEPGAAFAFFMPRVYPVGDRPSNVTNVSDLNYVTATYQGREGSVTTNDMTKSAIRFGLG